MTQEVTKTRRVRFADSVGRELVTIFLIDLICSLQTFKKQPIEGAPQAHCQRQSSELARQRPRPAAASQQQQKQQQQHENKQHENYNHQKQKQQHKQNHVHLQHQQLGPSSTLSISTSNQNHFHPSLAQPNSNRPQQFVCDFTQPVTLLSFKERIRLNKVHLETCQLLLGERALSVSSTIRVANVAYEKVVTLRYTSDEWRTFTDCSATYKPGSCDGWSDKFVATFSAPIGQLGRIKFAINFRTPSGLFWDNNGGLNYTIKRLS